MSAERTILVLGASGQTGRHFTRLAQEARCRVRALVRDPARLAGQSSDIDLRRGSITDDELDLDGLVTGTDAVVSFLGDARAQRTARVNTAFVRRLVPAMRRQGVRRFLYQAGGLSAAPGQRLSPVLWAVRNTVARGYIGQHEDNEAVMRYLVDEAEDVAWTVHRAGIGSDGPSKGVLERSRRRPSIATFRDCAAYSLRVLDDPGSVHTCEFSAYRR